MKFNVPGSHTPSSNSAPRDQLENIANQFGVVHRFGQVAVKTGLQGSDAIVGPGKSGQRDRG